MRKKRKRITTLILSLTLLLGSLTLPQRTAKADATLTPEAEKVLQNWYDNVNNTYSNIAGSDGQKTGKVEHGVNDIQQTWILYGVNQYGEVVANPVLIDKPGHYIGWRDCSVGYNQNMCNPRYDTTKKPTVVANTLNIPKAFVMQSGISISNFQAVKEFVNNNDKKIIETFWPGTTFQAEYENSENFERFIVMEPVFWHGIYKVNDTTQPEKVIKTLDQVFEEWKNLHQETYLMTFQTETLSVYKDMPDPFKKAVSIGEFRTNPTIRSRYLEPAVKQIIINTYNLKPVVEGGGAAKSKYEVIGDFCGTVYQGAKYEMANVDCFRGVYSYRHKNYCNVVKYSQDDWCGKFKAGSKSENISNNDIIAGGYGIAAFSNRGGGMNADPGLPDPNYNPVSLYETKNYDSTHTFDISEAIPSSEYLTNEINVASFVGDGGFVTTKEQKASKSWLGSCTYTYTVHDWYQVKDYKETDNRYILESEQEMYRAMGYTITKQTTGSGAEKVTKYIADKTWWHYGGEKADNDPNRMAYNSYTRTIKTLNYTFTASLNYQYINQTPHIYSFFDAAVTNGSYGLAYYNKDNSTVPATVTGVMTLHNNGNGVDTIVDSKNAYPVVNYKGSSDHYKWAGSIGTTTCDVIVLNKGYAHNDETKNHNFDNDIAAKEYGKVQELAGKIQNGTKSRNDGLKIQDKKAGTNTVCNDSWATGCTVTAYKGNTVNESTPVYATYVGNDASKQYGYSGVLEKINNELTASRVSGSQLKQIPAGTLNADYATGMSVNWVNIFDDITLYNMKAGIVLGSGESIYRHVMRDGVLPHHTGTLLGPEADSYPVRVHTPAESPIKIVTNTGAVAYEKTQLITGSSLNAAVDNQLLLDRSYYIKWDSKTWTSAVYAETPQGYEDIFDKYVTEKWMQFPFGVVYNNMYYPTLADGYTEWILVQKPVDVETSWNYGVNITEYESANHWQMTPFYIPTYASECGAPGDDKWVNVKVIAINAGTFLDAKNTKTSIYKIDTASREDLYGMGKYDENYDANSQKANYIAICNRRVQLSGWVYDFTIVGTSNIATLTGEGLEDIDVYTNEASLAERKMELKTGLKDRLGNNYIRYAIDGAIAGVLDRHQLLPLRDGSSYEFSAMGDIWRGQNFAFTLKTIANLDRMYDSIEITPSYTYVKKDGTYVNSDNLCLVEIDQYAVDTPDDNDTVKSLVFHDYNPNDTDVTTKWGNQYRLVDRMFRNSYYDDEDITAYHYADWVNRSTDNENNKTGNVSGLDAQQYMYRKVGGWTISHISIPAEARYLSGEYEQLAQNEGREGTAILPYSFNGYGSAQEELFKHSMQQWNGQFGVPMNIRLVDTTGRQNYDIYDELTNITDTQGYFRWDEAPFEKWYGEMIIDFDIVVYKTYCEDCHHFCGYTNECGCETHHLTSKPYLQYNGAGGGGLNMWERQGKEAKPGEHTDIDTVVKVDMGRSMSDYFAIGILNIN